VVAAAWTREEEVMGDASQMERRVYVLPSEMADRIKTYQTANRFLSEVEAVRCLLNMALQTQDTPDDILRQLRARFNATSDIRRAAADVLACHVKVTSILFTEDGSVTFECGPDEVRRLPLRNQSACDAHIVGRPLNAQ
jgi:Arc/MetJ-type ribon-helix-helix transcriptional regulator